MSLRFKTIIGIALIQAFLLVTIIWNAQFLMRQSHEQVLRQRAETATQLFATTIKEAVLSMDLAYLDRFVETVVKHHDFVYVRVLKTDRRVLAEAGKPALLSRPFHADTHLREIDDGVFDGFSPIEEAGVDYGRVEVGLSTQTILSSLKHSQTRFAIIAAIELFLSILLSALLGSKLVRRLNHFKEASKRISIGEVGYQIESVADDEIGITAKMFNRMSLRLRDSLEEIKNKNKYLKKEITKRREAETQLVQHRDNLEGLIRQKTLQVRRSEAMLKMILDSMPYAVVIVGTEKRIRYANEVALAMMGYETRECVTGRVCYETFCPTEANRCPILDLGRELDRSERTISTREGKKIPILKSATRLILEDEAVVLETFVDITESKQAERDLRKAKIRAEEANVAKSQFLANMSHEIRTPLNGIIGMAELALDTNLSPDQRKIAETIEKESNTLLELINSILDYSKIEAGKFQLESIPFDLRVLIEDVASSIAIRAKNYGLEFISFVSRGIPGKLLGDPGRLRQVLNNLAGNALKFTEKGEIAIRAHTVEEGPDHASIRFEVTDTGIGIPEEQQSSIFDGFAQANGSTTRQYGGTGLGTTIAKQLVEMMGGEIGLISTQGEGSTFWFTVEFEKAPQRPAKTADNVSLSGLKVMVVDDMDAPREIMMEYLTYHGIEAFESASPIEALERIEAASVSPQPFNLLLSDIRMPEMDGFELASRIKGNDALKNMAIVLISGINEIGDGEKCRSIGVDGYLNKPVKLADLTQTIKMVCGVDVTADSNSRTLVTRDTIDEMKSEQIRVLLVEDYPTNQQVALNHLHKAGYLADLAENGQEAVVAYGRNPYDIILMDMNMPVMDGYKAIDTIRKMENASEKDGAAPRRIPIIAITANALSGDREKCLVAGADDYLSKPLKKERLLAMIGKWTDSPVPEANDACLEKNHDPSDHADEPVNYAQALKEFGNEADVLADVLTGFVCDAKQQIEKVRNAVVYGDTDMIASEAHAIKGGSSNLTASFLADAAAALEAAAKSGSLTQTASRIDALEIEVQRMAQFVETL
ncbi:hypothetical protein DSCW_42680 [Desulfosarcina widdelii]|uniref:Sensory/regulatory protein RpfC n=1 Tax=Desulfosarcina widdelii TaxID=947919 RepID=A0A5K7ZAX6_9BACT|nr:response regulator [Desulfosarcina widdelii]BBO76851.1 hypothetical protein DSCW_42680 [Desulfosarcina widdelii]